MHYYDQPDPDITSWLEYFLQGVVNAFEQVKDNALAAARKDSPDEANLPADILQKIGPRERILLSHFEKNLQIRSKDICRLFDINERTARDLLGKWIKEGILQKKGSGNRNAYYVLTPPYQQLFDWSYEKPSAHLDAKLIKCLRAYHADKSVQRRPYHA
jgi:Fic family protein